MKRRTLLLAVLTLPVLGILLSGNQFIYPARYEYSDLTISHWPNAIFIHRSLLENGQIPIWSNSILGGYPLAANPLSGLHYPPGWAAILWPEPVTFNLLACLHLVWMGLGMVAFLRASGISFGPAILGAVLLESLPKFQAHYFSGHISLLYAMSWLPWLLLLEKRRLEGQSSNCLPPGGVWGVIALADIRVAAYAGLIWLAYSAFCPWGHCKAGNSAIRAIGRWALTFAIQTGLGVLIAAPLLLPMMQYVTQTARAGMTAADRLALAVQPMDWLGVFIPFYGKNVEHVVYGGALALILVAAAGFLPSVRRNTLFWLGIAVLCGLLSMGDAIPGLGLVMSLPGLDLLRVPGRFLLAGGFAIAVAASFALQAILEFGMPRSARMAVAAVSLTGWMFNGVVGVVGGFHPEVVHGAVIWALGFGLIILFSWRRLRRVWLVPVVILLVVADLGWINWNSKRPVTKEVALAASPTLDGIVQDDNRPFRVYSPSYSVPQQVAAWHNLELADGVDPLQLRETIAWMTEASGVPQRGYSVTLPPFSSGNPAVDNQTYVPDAQKLGWMNVRYVVSAFPIDATGLRLITSDGALWTYHNLAERPRVWVQDTSEIQDGGMRPATVAMQTANRVTVQAEGPGWLVLADVNFPGWSVTVDGQKQEMVTTYGLLRSVRIGSGAHTVVFQFSMPALFAGLAVSLTTCLGWWISRVKKSRRPRSRGA